MNRKARVLGLLAIFILLGSIFVAWYMTKYNQQVKPLEVLGEPGQKVRPFSFTDQEGKPFTNKDVEGKVYVVNYFFATCKGICPHMNENFSKVYAAFRGNKDILFLSHTVNPGLDTPAALLAYGRRFDADPKQWKFLTGDKKELYDQARYSYLISAKDDTTGLTIKDDFIHDQHFVLVDRHGSLRGKFYDGLDSLDVKQLIADIKTLLAEKE